MHMNTHIYSQNGFLIVGGVGPIYTHTRIQNHTHTYTYTHTHNNVTSHQQINHICIIFKTQNSEELKVELISAMKIERDCSCFLILILICTWLKN